MSATIREMRRAPGRVATSIFAIALAIAAIGVFAVPGVAENSLRSIAETDQLTHIQLTTSPMKTGDGLRGIDGVAALEVRIAGSARLADGGTVSVLSVDDRSQINLIRVDAGRAPVGAGEALVSPGVGEVGETIVTDNGQSVVAVGVGETTWWATEKVLYVTPATARALTGLDGYNMVLARLDDPSADNLDATVDEIRDRLAVDGVTLTTFPETLAGGAHPIEDDLKQVSFMIGSLGVVAGIVALTLLASTANVIVTERTRDAAIMRALGGTRRQVRRDLRRLAVTIGVIGTIIGIPLGVVVANVVARMVLTRFAGITPGIGLAPPVMAASVVFGVAGARLVSGRVARRVCKSELAPALRDADATPFGHRWSDRLFTKLSFGGLIQRIAMRSVVRRRARGVAVAAQFAGAVAAAVLVASLAASITDFNGAELESYEWESVTTPVDPVYPNSFGDSDGTPDAEVAIHTYGAVDDWELELFGVTPETDMVAAEVSEGTWLPTSPRSGGAAPAVLAAKFAEQEGIGVGDQLTVALASGDRTYEIVGLHPVRSVALFVPREVLAHDLGVSGGNSIWTRGDAIPASVDGLVTTTTTREALLAEDVAARDAILAIFAAIGAIVVAIAVLGTASTVAMNLYERRVELATLRASGARRRDIRTLVTIELGGLAIMGWAVGTIAGVLGAKLIMDFFATANAVELGFSVAWAAVPITAVATTMVVMLLARSAARASQRTPVAVTLRATA